jgi:hypothetical protein
LLLGFAAEVRATTFPCTEAGFDSAIVAAEGGDPGPDNLSCTPEDTIQIFGSRTIDANIILDGGGATLACVNDAPHSPRSRP